MRQILYRLALTTLTLALALSVSATTLAEGGTKGTLQRDEFGVVFTNEWPTDEQTKAYGDYVEEKSKTLGGFHDWPLEDKAAFSDWMQEHGIPETYIVNGRPGSDNKAAADVVAKAKEAVIAKYNLMPEVLNKFKVQITFNVIDPDHPMWEIEFRVKDGEDIMDLGYYRVDINDRTGEVVRLNSIADAAG